jgi:hypothetical protein
MTLVGEPEREARGSGAVDWFLRKYTEKMTYRDWSAVANEEIR